MKNLELPSSSSPSSQPTGYRTPEIPSTRSVVLRVLSPKGSPMPANILMFDGHLRFAWNEQRSASYGLCVDLRQEEGELRLPLRYEKSALGLEGDIDLKIRTRRPMGTKKRRYYVAQVANKYLMDGSLFGCPTSSWSRLPSWYRGVVVDERGRSIERAAVWLDEPGRPARTKRSV